MTLPHTSVKIHVIRPKFPFSPTKLKTHPHLCPSLPFSFLFPFSFLTMEGSFHQNPELPFTLTGSIMMKLRKKVPSLIFSKPSAPLVIISLTIYYVTLQLIPYALASNLLAGSGLAHPLSYLRAFDTESHHLNVFPPPLLWFLALSHLLGNTWNANPSDKSSCF